MSCLHLRGLVENWEAKKKVDRLSSKAVWPLAVGLSSYLTAFNFIWLSTWKSLAGLAAATVDTHTHTDPEISSHMASFKTPGIYVCVYPDNKAHSWNTIDLKGFLSNLANMLPIHSTAIIVVMGVTWGHGWTGHLLIFSPHCEHFSLSKALMVNQPLLPFDTCIVLGASS